jgi:hypothetical protein
MTAPGNNEPHDPNPVWGRPEASSADTTPAGVQRPVDPTFGAQFAYAPEPVVAVKPKGSGSKLLNVVLGLAVVVAIGGVAFAAGRLTAPASAATNAAGGIGFGAGAGAGAGFGNGPRASGAPGNFRGGAAGFGAGFGGAGLRGTVTAVTSTGITLTVGQTTLDVPTDASTTYHNQAAGAPADVTVGSTVLVELGAGAGGGAGGVRGGGFGAGASPAPGASPGTFTLGPATDVTVVAK